MPAMPVVHEEMHQRAGKDEQIGQHPEDMGRVLRQKVKGRDEQKPAQHDAAAGAPPSAPVIMHVRSRHGSHPPQVIGHHLVGVFFLIGRERVIEGACGGFD
jgi:hypothetical protein